jgi:Reverse transcriptase (RNA-dependent DNA polymerase).
MLIRYWFINNVGFNEDYQLIMLPLNFLILSSMCGIRKCFCDLVKAFDSVNHEVVLYKLEYHGIQVKILDWFKPYLVNRKERVVLKSSNIHNFSSNCELVKHGVP